MIKWIKKRMNDLTQFGKYKYGFNKNRLQIDDNFTSGKIS